MHLLEPRAPPFEITVPIHGFSPQELQRAAEMQAEMQVAKGSKWEP